MLTKADLRAIEKIVKTNVRSEVEAESESLQSKLDSTIRTSRMRLQEQMIELAHSQKDSQIKQNKIYKEVKIVRRELKQTSDFLDRENLATLKRVKRIEEYLNLPSVS